MLVFVYLPPPVFHHQGIVEGVLNNKISKSGAPFVGYFMEAIVDLIITTSLFYYLIKNRRSCIHTRLEYLIFYDRLDAGYSGC